MTLRRKIHGNCAESSNVIDNIEYNAYSGAQKIIEVGPALKFAAAITAEYQFCPGDQLFVFNPTAAIAYVTLSKVTGAAAGVAAGVDTFPVFAEAYTPISGSDYKFIIGTAGLFLYVLRDDNQQLILDKTK